MLRQQSQKMRFQESSQLSCADSRFSRKFWFLVPISRWWQMPILPLPLRTPMNRGDANHWKSAPAIATSTYHQIVIRQLEENEDIRFWSKFLKSSDGMLSGAQKHVSCFDQSIKCFLRNIFSLRRTAICFQVNLKHDFTVGINYKINLN